jgi:hypothetical protein
MEDEEGTLVVHLREVDRPGMDEDTL